MIELLPTLHGETPADRACEMEALYPGLRFLPDATPIGKARLIHRLDRDALLLPRAVFDNNKVEMRYGDFNQLVAGFNACYMKQIGYVTFTALKFYTGMPFEEMFALLKKAYFDDFLVVRWRGTLQPDQRYPFTHLAKLCRWEDRQDERWNK